ncbi:MAG: SRPBCC family protein [Thermoplasmatota archaeon]
MPKEFHLQKAIAASPETVFAVLSDLDGAPTWMPAIRKIQSLTPGPLKEGSKWIETRTGPNGKPFVSTLSVTKFQPGQAFGLHVDHRMMGMDLAFALTPEATGTLVDYRASVKPKGIGKLFGGKIAKMMAKEDADLLDRLEGQAAKAAPKAAPKAAKKAKKKAA